MAIVNKLGILAAALTMSMGAALAENVSVEAVMSPTDQIRMDFKDGSKHFVLMVRREGEAVGDGLFAGTKVVEHGWHDIHPPLDADPQGYLELTAANGDVAYLKWTVRAVFTKGEERPNLLDYGVWELTSGTGQFAGKRGVGTLIIKPASPTDRKFILTGEVGEQP